MNTYTIGPPAVADPPDVTAPGERCPSWCDPTWCCAGIVHRTADTVIDAGEVTFHLSVRQWRNGHPDDLLPGWAPAVVTTFISHKTDTIELGGEPVVVHAAESVPVSICFGMRPMALRKLLAAQMALLSCLERDEVPVMAETATLEHAPEAGHPRWCGGTGICESFGFDDAVLHQARVTPIDEGAGEFHAQLVQYEDHAGQNPPKINLFLGATEDLDAKEADFSLTEARLLHAQLGAQLALAGVVIGHA